MNDTIKQEITQLLIQVEELKAELTYWKETAKYWQDQYEEAESEIDYWQSYY